MDFFFLFSFSFLLSISQLPNTNPVHESSFSRLPNTSSTQFTLLYFILTIHQISSSLIIIHISQTLATHKNTTINHHHHCQPPPKSHNQSTPNVRRRLSHHAITRRQRTTAMQPDDSQCADLNQIVTVENRDRSRPKIGVLVYLVSRLSSSWSTIDDRRSEMTDLHRWFLVVSKRFRLGFGGSGGGVEVVVVVVDLFSPESRSLLKF